MERRFDVHVVHLLDPAEMKPEIAGDLRLADAETGEVASSPSMVRRSAPTASGCMRSWSARKASVARTRSAITA